jgi:lambda family phage tail tape measure protein
VTNENITRVTADATGYTAELERAARSAQAFAESNEAAARRIEAAQNAVAEAAANGSDVGTRAITNYINALARRSDAFGKDAIAMERSRAAALGISETAEPLIAHMEAVAKATADAAAAVKAKAQADRDAAAEVARISAAAERAAADTQRFVDAINKEAASLGKSRAELLAMEAAERGVSTETAAAIAKIQDHADATAKASQHTHEFSLSTNASRRELLVLAHELSQGNFKQFGGSMMVLAEQTNATSLIFNKTALTIGAFVGVAALAVSTTIHAAEALAEYGESIEKIAKSTGLSTDGIQKFGFAAGVVGVSTKDAAGALTDLGKAQNEAIHGNNDAAAAFKALGISQADLKNTSPDQLLLKVADAFAASKDGAGKAAVANQLFGSSGADLISLLDRGSAGLNDLSAAASDAGAVLGADTVAQLAAFKEQLNESHEKMSAVSLSAKTELIPTILNLNNALSGNVALKPLLVSFYDGVAFVMKSVASAAATVVIGFEQTAEALATVATVAGLAMTGEFRLAGISAQIGYEKLKKEGQGYADFMSRLWSNTAPAAPHVAAPTRQINFATGQNSPKKADESAITDGLKDLKGQLDAREQLLRESIEHIKSLQQQGVIDARTEIQEEHDARVAAYADELKIVDQEIELASRKKQKAAMVEFQNKKKSIEQAILASDQQAADAQAALQAKEIKASQAYTVALSAELQQRADAIAAASTGRSLGSIAADEQQRITEVAKEGTQKYADLVKSLTENKISDSQFDAEVGALQRYQAKRIALEQYATEQIKAMNSGWSSGAQKALNDYADAAANKFQQVGSLVGDVTKGMEDAFVSFVTTGKFSFSDLATSIIADIVRIQARALIAQAATGASSWLSGLFSAGTSLAGGLGLGGSSGMAVSSGSYYTPSSPVLFHATGGLITGPGTGTSDSILARLSNGEGVLTAAAMKRLGANALNALNNGASITGLAKFATGGVVGASSAVDPRQRGGAFTINAPVTVEGGSNQQANQSGADELNKKIVQALKAVLQNERKQGGVLWKLQNGIA